MKLSELIKEAQAAMAEYGDIEVSIKEYGCGYCNGGEDYMQAETTVYDINMYVSPAEYRRVTPAFVIS